MNYWVIEGHVTVWECFIRIILAGACGALLGIERSRRQKDAGIRTHIIMAMGAALAMLVSKYGFMDMPLLETMRADGSRIASNILTSVGFLGAGVIFMRGGSIKGLTTAAGLWTMAGIGMTIGAGLYYIGIFATIVTFIVQLVLHIWMPSHDSSVAHEVKIVIKNSKDAITTVLQYLNQNNIDVIETEIRRTEDEMIKIYLSVRVAKKDNSTEIANIMSEVPDIVSVNM